MPHAGAYQTVYSSPQFAREYARNACRSASGLLQQSALPDAAPHMSSVTPSSCSPYLGPPQPRSHTWFSNAMDGQASEPLVNRNEAIPIVSITGPEDYVPTPEAGGRSPSKRDVLRQALPTGKLREKLESLSSQAERPESPNTIPDRLFTMYRYHLRSGPNTVLTLTLRLLQQVLPSQDIPEGSSINDRRSRKYVDRPGFSLPVMSNNFRRFNARHVLLPTATSLSLTSSVELESRLSSKTA